METFLEIIAYKNADIIITVSEKEKQLLTHAGFPKNKITVAPNGVDTGFFGKSGNGKATNRKIRVWGFKNRCFPLEI